EERAVEEAVRVPADPFVFQTALQRPLFDGFEAAEAAVRVHKGALGNPVGRGGGVERAAAGEEHAAAGAETGDLGCVEADTAEAAHGTGRADEHEDGGEQ